MKPDKLHRIEFLNGAQTWLKLIHVSTAMIVAERQKAATQLYGSRTASPRQPCSSSTAAVRQPHRSSRAILESSSAAASQ